MRVVNGKVDPTDNNKKTMSQHCNLLLCIGLFVLIIRSTVAFSPVRTMPMVQPTVATTRRSTVLQRKAHLEAILWDMDGVLADTERDGHRIAFNEAFREFGINDTDWTVELYGELLEVGGGKERMTAHWNAVGWPALIPFDQRASTVKALHERKTELFLDKIANIPLRPGVLRLIDEALTEQIRLAVCSTSNVKAVTTLVQTLMGLERAQHISIFAGDMVERKKPAPDVYNLAVNTMGIQDKTNCVIVEDSAIGLGAAKAAGIACIVTKSTYTQNEDFTGANMVVDNLGEPNDPSGCVTLDTLRGLVVGAI